VYKIKIYDVHSTYPFLLLKRKSYICSQGRSQLIFFGGQNDVAAPNKYMRLRKFRWGAIHRIPPSGCGPV